MSADEWPARSRSRFSISAFLPARHPPLRPDPAGSSSSSSSSAAAGRALPRMPTQSVARHNVMMENLSAPSPVMSCRASPGEEYLSPLDRLELLRGPPVPPSAVSRYSTDDHDEGDRIDFSASPPHRVPRRGHDADSDRTISPPKRRPPPLDLTRTKKAYPVPPAQNEPSPVPGVSPPVRPRRPDDIHQPPLPAKTSPQAPLEPASRLAVPPPPVAEDKAAKKEKKIRRKAVEDDMSDEFAVVDIGHKYPSWQGGKVDIRPGEMIPPGLIRPTREDEEEKEKSRLKAYLDAPFEDDLAPPPPRRERRQTDRYTKPLEVYDSVLHDVLLEQVYLEPSPGMVLTPSPKAESFDSRSRIDRRRQDGAPPKTPRTLFGQAGEALRSAKRVARESKWMPRGILKREDSDAEMSIRRMREREEAEMGRYRNVIRGVPAQVNGGRLYETADPGRTWNRATDRKTYVEVSDSHGWKTPGRIERGLENLGQAAWRSVSGAREKQTEAWRQTKQKEEKAARRQKIWKCGIMIFIMLLVAMTIGLCATLLTRSGSSSSSGQGASTSDSGLTKTVPGATGTSAGTPAPTSTSTTLSSCLQRYGDSANAYPCSDCVPLLTSTTNDFLQPLVNGNATNVGAALQYCAMMDIVREMNTTGVSGWGQDRSVCGWQGVQCDPRGRVGTLRMTYPNVPRQLPSSLGNLVGLGALHITGNSTVPTGSFPTSIFGPNLNSIDLQYTALTGPIASANWSAVPGLTTLYLANNKNLGTGLPNLSGNTKLVTLAATGQGISSINSDTLPSSLTYIDLSFNALTGQIPAFSQVTYLKTLYLQNNNLSQAPASLPSNLEVLSLTSNPNLSGSMPAALCASTALTSCDLRSTKLGGANITTIGVTFSGTATSSSAAPTATSSSRSCGSCRYD